MQTLLSIVVFLLLSYGGINIYLFLKQRNLLYFPVKAVEAPAEYGLDEMVPVALNAGDGVRLAAWYKAAGKNGPVVVYFHGNAGHLGDRREKFKAFIQEGFGLLALSYRGYGNSQGEPSEEGIYKDARAAISYLLAQHIPVSRMIFFGESLGSGVAVQMATEYREVKAIVLEAPYTSIEDRAAELYPYIPVRFLLRDKFCSYKKIGQVQRPILVFHGKKDTVMPVKFGEKLFSLANEPKKIYLFEEVGHTDFDSKQLVAYIRNFLTETTGY